MSWRIAFNLVAVAFTIAGAAFNYLAYANRRIHFNNAADDWSDAAPSGRKKNYTPLGWRFLKLCYLCGAIALPLDAVMVWLQFRNPM